MFILKLKEYTEDDFPLTITRAGGIDGEANYPLHKHDYSELVIILKGRGVHFTGNEEYSISSGDVFIVPQGIEHGYKNSETLYLINIMFDLDKLIFPQHDLLRLPGFHALFNIEPVLRKAHEFRSRLILSESAFSFVQHVSLKIQDELKNKIPGCRTLSVGLLFELLTFLSRYTPACQTAEFQTVYMIGKVISFLENNFKSSNVTLDKLSALTNMSKRNFQRYFKKATGVSPIRYLLKLRIDKAKEILTSFPDAQISEVALHTGFEDSNYFTRQFKAIAGISPRQYRRKFAN